MNGNDDDQRPVKRINMTAAARVERIKPVTDWLQANKHRPDACSAMRTYIGALLKGRPSELSNGSYSRLDQPDDPDLHYAVVPGTDAIVTFYERSTVPVRTVVIVSIIPAP